MFTLSKTPKIVALYTQKPTKLVQNFQKNNTLSSSLYHSLFMSQQVYYQIHSLPEGLVPDDASPGWLSKGDNS